MTLIDEYTALKMPEKDLREFAEKTFKRKIPYTIGKKAIAALVAGKLSEPEKQRLFKGVQPDKYSYFEIKRLTRNQLKKMIKDKYGFWFPDNVDQSYMEKIIEGKLRLEQLPQAVVYEIGKANQSQGASFFKQFGLSGLPLLKKFAKKADIEKGKSLAKRLQDPRYKKDRYK